MGNWADRVLDAIFAGVRGALWLGDALGSLARARPVRRAMRVVLVGAAHALVFLGVSYLFLFRVTVGQVGVRLVQLGTAGVEERDHAPGLHPGLRWLHAWHMLDARTHVAAFGLSGDPTSRAPLELRTRDGNLVGVSATVLYRIRPGEAWRLVADGLKLGYRGLAAEAAANVLRAELAELSSEELASTEARSARMAAALPRLNARLASLHLEAETIQLHEVAFWAEYEKALQAERLEREGARLARTLARLEQEKRGDTTAEQIEAEELRIRAEAARELERLRAEALLAIARVGEEAASYTAGRRSEADAFYEVELAAGRREVERAEATRERARADALGGEAGRLWLAREAAGRLTVRKALLNASDPRLPALVDLDAVVRLLLGARPAGGETR